MTGWIRWHKSKENNWQAVEKRPSDLWLKSPSPFEPLNSLKKTTFSTTCWVQV